MAKKWMKFEIKEVSTEGSFEGLLSPYGNLDLTGDIVEPGAFTKTLQEHGNTRPMLWQHDDKRPIGKLTLEDRPDGLYCKGQLTMSNADGPYVNNLIKDGVVKGLSIGYESVKDNVEKGVRHLKEIRLWEGSVVTFPANMQAIIMSAKMRRREQKEDFAMELAEIQLQDMGYQMFSALGEALGDLPWSSGVANADKVKAAETTLQQFSDAFMAYLPEYLDFLSTEYGPMETMSREQIDTKRLARKAGRRVSAAMKATMNNACAQIKSGHDIISALAEDEAAEDKGTSASEAATQPEPVLDHSALSSLLTEMKEQYQWNPTSKSN